MPTVDSLDIQITTSATSANKSLDKLASTISNVQRQLGKTTSVSGFNSLRTATTRLNNDLVKTQKVSKNTTAGFAKMAISARVLRVAIEGIGKSIKSSMDYIETLNYSIMHGRKLRKRLTYPYLKIWDMKPQMHTLNLFQKEQGKLHHN